MQEVKKRTQESLVLTDNFLEYVKVQTRDGDIVSLKLTRMQKKLWDVIQEQIKKGEKKFTLLKWYNRITQAMLEGRNINISDRAVKGRMDDMSIVKRECDYSEGSVSGEVLAAEIYSKPETKSPIYFTSIGFMCNCGHMMCDEVLDRKKWEIRLFCTNLHCSENLVTKIVKFPPITDYVVCPSSA